MRLSIVKTALFALLVTCSTGAFSQVSPMSRAEYIDKYKSLAIDDMDKYGIPASITMAQALLESDNGNSELARNANNHFGIKTKKDWPGEVYIYTDDAPNEKFRKYDCVEDSFRDHSEFLDKSSRYQSLFNLDITDYTGWARGLKAAGYATNPLYAEMLIKIIEDNRLYLLDMNKPIPPVAPVERQSLMPQYASSDKIDPDRYAVSVLSMGGHAVYTNNGAEFILASKGESYESIAGQLGISAARLRRYNDQKAGSQPAEGSMVYIRSKARRSSDSQVVHVAKQGDTLWSISQLYGIRLKNLSRMNRGSHASPLPPGDQIRLM